LPQDGALRIQDDMQPLYEKALKADALILGTPIYLGGRAPMLKTFIDRWYSFTEREKDEKLGGQGVGADLRAR
jgi:multimeric flavodoxin WrbA